MRIGIIGAGQLGQMLGAAARELGMECLFVDPCAAPPAASEGRVICQAFDDAGALAELARDCDVVTYEFENVPVDALLAIAADVTVYPPPEALRIAQDRLSEKQLFDQLDIPLPAYRAVDSLSDLKIAADALGLPLVLKTRRFGYDGKGQCVVRDAGDIDSAWDQLGEQALIAEAFVSFDYEVSVIGVRNPDGEIAIWPLTHNEHSDGSLRQSRAPAAAELLEPAAAYMRRMLERLDYVGVLALELFVVGENLLANEFAPRVHNSGHWTIEGADTSQFSNHLRAICGQPPGSTACSEHAGMINLIGRMPEAAARLERPNCYLHDYGKTPRAGRKLGHVTLVAKSAAERDQQLLEIAQTVT